MLSEQVSWPTLPLQEDDTHFQSVLIDILHVALRRCGAIGLVATLLYVGLSVFGLGYHWTWTYEAVITGGLDRQIVVVGILIVAALSVSALVLAQARCSLRTGRLYGGGAVIAATAVATFEGAVRGAFSIEYVILIYVLVVGIIPFRPLQVVGIGGGTALVVYLLGPTGLAWTGSVSLDPVMAQHLLFLAGASVLITGASLALRLRHRSFGATQASLQKTRALLHRAENVARVGSWAYDPATDTVHGTKEFYDILDLPDGTRFDLDRWLQFFPPSSRPEIRRTLDRGLADAAPFDQEVSLVTATDAQRQVRLRGTAQRQNGEVVGLTGILQDITERQAMAQRLREQERLLRSITENVSDGIYRLEPGNGLVYANRALARLFGYDDVADLLTLDPEALCADPDSSSDLLSVSEQADRTERKVTFRRKDGSTFVGLLGGTVVRNKDGEVQHVDGVVTDITDHKKRENALKGERDRSEELFESLLRRPSTHPVNRPS